MNSFRSAILKGQSADPANPLVSQKKGKDSDGQHLTSVGIPRDATRSADHRDGDRHRLSAETATVLFKRRKYEVELVNLSGGGAMIRSEIKPRLWDRVDLILGEGSALECAVRWLRGDRIGLEFAHETRIECEPEQRDAILLEVIRRSFPEAAIPAPPSEPRAEVVEAPAADPSRRGDARHPLIWNGKILWQHDCHTVRLRNISSSGALIDSNVDFPEGAELMLDLGEGRQLFATVGWSRGGQAGLVFKQKFDIALLAAVRPEVAPGWQRPTHLGDSVASDDFSSPWASEWQRSSLEELRQELEGFMKR